MSKRNVVPHSLLCVLALVALNMFVVVVSAQKTPNTVAGAPLAGVDVKLGRNPGGGGQARKTDKDGKIDLSDLAPGSYWLEIVGGSTVARQVTVVTRTDREAAADPGDGYNYIAVTIAGNSLVGKSKTRSLDVNKGQFVNPPPKNAARTGTPVETYSGRIEFEIGPRTGGGSPEPLNATVVKSKSNIYNN